MMECEVVREALINSHRACVARYQRGGCGQIGRSLVRTDWHRNSGYDLRRTRRDFLNLIRNAAHGGINQCFPKPVCWF
jgi:hypothetical protein